VPAATTPRGLRAVWLLGCLVFLVSTGLPWTSCTGSRGVDVFGGARGGLSLMQYLIRWTLSQEAIHHLWALGLALPIFVVTAVASLETRGQPYRRPGPAVIMLAFATVVGVWINTWNLARTQADAASAFGALVASSAARGRSLSSAMPTWLPNALRVVFIVPALGVASWGVTRRDQNAAPLAARWLAAASGLSVPVVWAGQCDRFGATLAVVVLAALGVMAPLVSDDPSPLAPRARRTAAIATAAWIVATLVFVSRAGVRLQFFRWPIRW
jgi:hypothetical protein